MSIRSNVDARRLNQRIQIKRKTVDANGDPAGSVLLVECWAAVDGAKASGPEPSVGGSVMTKRDYTVWVRSDVISRFGITETDFIEWGGRILNIKDMPDQQLRGRLIVIICNTGLNAG